MFHIHSVHCELNYKFYQHQQIHCSVYYYIIYINTYIYYIIIEYNIEYNIEYRIVRLFMLIKLFMYFQQLVLH